jgi:branched-chain amino acid transport system permease protein
MVLGVPGVLAINLRDRTSFYYTVVGLVAVVYLLARRIVASPFGSVLATIRENEVRSATMGYPVSRYKQVAFALSGAIGGIAGALYVPYQQFVSPDLLYWETSGLVIIMVLLGGMRTLWGPVLGGAIVVFLSDWLTAYTKHYLLLLGLVFVLVVIYLPNGIAGAFKSLHRRSRAGQPEAQSAEGVAPQPAGSVHG